MKASILSREFVYFKTPTFIADAIWHCIAFWLAVTYPWRGSRVDLSTQLMDMDNTIGIFALLFISFCFVIWVYDLKIAQRGIFIGRVCYRAIVQVTLVMTAFYLLLALIYKVTPRHMILEQWTYGVIGIIIIHTCVNMNIRWLRKRGYNRMRILFVGADHNNRMLYRDMTEKIGWDNYAVEGVFSSKYEEQIPEELKHLGKVDEVFPYLGKDNDHRIDEIYCSLDPADQEEGKVVRQLIDYCNKHFITFFFVPTMEGYPKHRMEIRKKGTVNVIRLHEEPLASPLSKALKRVVDITISGIFLCTAYPFVYLFAAIGIKLSSKGPIYFKQARTGYNGKSFLIYKFRSMHVNVDADKVQATKDDPRKFAFGNFIRKTSIDELPQFINVFKGDMSLIGPRPHMEYHTEQYGALIDDYMVRHLCKPGITGWAQISGCRGETETVEQMRDRVEHDIWYIENWSPALDIEIFFRTIWQVLGGDKQAY